MTTRTWTKDQDEALLRVMQAGHEKAEPFFAAYQRASGDTVHDIGGVVFRAVQVSSVIRDYMTPALRRDLNRASDEARAKRKAAKGTTPPQTPKAPAPKAEVTVAAKRDSTQEMREVVVDGKTYVNQLELRRLLDLGESAARRAYERIAQPRELRLRTEERDRALSNLAIVRDQCETNRLQVATTHDRAAVTEQCIVDANRRADASEEIAQRFHDDAIKLASSVGMWRERATMLARVVDGDVHESRRSLAAMILDAKD